MKVIKFDYAKDGAVAPKTYVVAHSITGYDYFEGYDLMEGKFKRFKDNNLVGNLQLLGNISNDVAKTGRVVSRAELLVKLGYDENAVKVVNELGVTDKQLAALYSKTSRDKVDVLDGYFVLSSRSQKIHISLYDDVCATMEVTPNDIRYYSTSGSELSREQFIKLVLKD